MLETTSQVLSLGLSVLKNTGEKEIRQLTNEYEDNKEYKLSIQEEDSLNKVVYDLCLLIKSQDEKCLNVCQSNIESLKSIISSIGSIENISMPTQLVDVIRVLNETPISNDQFSSLWLTLEGLIKKFYTV